MEKVQILLAETDCIFVELIKTFLRGSDFELVTCRKPDSLLETVRQTNPAVIYLSANIAGENLEYLQIIKQDQGTRDTPVIMICSKEDKDYQQHSSDAGCDYVLLKPLARKTFFASLYGFIDATGGSNKRLKTRLAVEYGFLAPAPFTFHSVDLSSKGMFVEIRNVLPLDTILSIRFCLPDSQAPIETSARVVWLNPPLNPIKPSLPPGMGLEFVDLHPEYAALITGFINEGKQRKAE